MSLVIVESPAKCKKIQSFLGNGWTVIATMGHIRALEEDLDAVGLDRDFDAKFAFLKGKSKAIQQLKEEGRKAKDIYLASDDDREGEAISYSVALLLGLNPRTAKRSVFHEITRTAVLHAVQNPRTIDMNRVDAQQARSILDMMVGFTMSRLLWSYVGSALSAGRCQTPALRIVAEREKEIDSFTSSRAWKLRGLWAASKAFQMDAALVDELEDEESARNFLENIHQDAGGTVQSSETRPWTQGAPKPLITSTLQQEASARNGCAPKRTMQIAQRLYEAGHITYMRTDHAVLSEEAVQKAQEIVRQQYGDAYVNSSGAAQKKGKKDPNAQEAHEAIRPTHFELADLPSNEDWNAIDKKIYALIRNRALQSVMAAARGDEHTIQFTADGDPAEFLWTSSYRRTTFDGWKKVGYGETSLDETEERNERESEDALWKSATSVKVGSKLQWKQLTAFPVDSRPPPRYNEATLVRELEKKGIGRPSTFAMLVGTILEKEYVKKEDKPAKEVQLLHLSLPAVGHWPPTEDLQTKKIGAEKDKLVPTPLGVRILDFLLREFSALFDYGFTSKMETRLDSIAEGKEQWKQLCRDIWTSYKDKYETLKKAGNSAAVKNSRSHDFGGGLKAVVAKQGPLLLLEDASGDKAKTKFLGWVDGVKFEEMTEAIARAHLATVQTATAQANAEYGMYENEQIVVKDGPYGKYAQCGSVRVPFVESDTAETLCAKFEAKKASVLHTLGEFEFRNGPYGVFMFKKTTAKGKKPQFVGLPEGLDPKSLTEEAAVRIYQTGIQQKARARHFSQNPTTATTGAATGGTARGGRGGGRGGFRGRGRGGRGRGRGS